MPKKHIFCTFWPIFRLFTSRWPNFWPFQPFFTYVLAVVYFDFWIWDRNPNNQSKSAQNLLRNLFRFFFQWMEQIIPFIKLWIILFDACDPIKLQALNFLYSYKNWLKKVSLKKENFPFWNQNGYVQSIWIHCDHARCWLLWVLLLLLVVVVLLWFWCHWRFWWWWWCRW